MIDAAARDAWSELEGKLRPFVARRVRAAADVDDIVQDVFLRMQRGLGSLRDEERFGPWVYRVARSAIVDHQRRSARHPLAVEEPPEEVAPVDDDDRAVERALANYIVPFVALLPSPYREALTLTELEGLTQKQAAEMLGVSLSGMKSRVQRGRQQLRAMLEQCCHIALDARGRIVGCEPRSDRRFPETLERTRVVPSCTSKDGVCMNEVPQVLAHDASYWKRADVEDASRWTHVLSAAEQEDLRRVVARLRDRPLASLTPTDVRRDGALAAAAERWRRVLRDGLGFVLLRGIDVDALSAAELETTFVALGLYLGSMVPQNLEGELLTHIRDTGADPTSPATRLYTTRAEQDFHTDGADVIGLLCRRTSRSGGASRIVSSGAIVAAMQRSRPDLYRELFGSFPWHYQEQGKPALWFSRPICTAPTQGASGARLNTFFIPWYIRRSQELAEAPRLTPAQQDAIAMIESLANDPSYHLDMQFQPGDVQWLKNAAILHKRTEYEDYDEPDRKRHLLRLWLSAPDFVDGDAQLRRGVTADNVS